MVYLETLIFLENFTLLIHKCENAIELAAMAEKLCLQWNDFKENVYSAFGRLRNDKELTDVTLACEDGQQMEAHKVILAASSPFFEKILQRNKHPHPLLYLRGFKSEDLVAILDFLYFGEANVYQENLDSFLAIAEELKLKGLTGQTTNDLVQEEDKPLIAKPVSEMTKELFTYRNNVGKAALSNISRALAIPNPIRSNLHALDEKVKSMMEKSNNMVQTGKRPDGKPLLTKAFICKVCGKEDSVTHIKNHIEANHLKGISVPCNYCDKAFCSRGALAKHKSRFHK